MRVELERFGDRDTGGTADLIRLTNARGSRVGFVPSGARVVSLSVPDRQDRFDDVVLGYDSLQGYREPATYAGAVVGRYANRVAGARFTLGGRLYRLDANDGPNHLHGGADGFDRQAWSYEVDERAGSISFAHTSPAGHAGYPGSLDVGATYRWADDSDRLTVDLTATTDAPTVVNLAHHGYWNLAGHAAGGVTGHLLKIAAESYTPVDEQLVTTGEILPVEGTRFDFRLPRLLDRAYDHNWVLDGERGTLRPVAWLRDPASGRELTVHTTEAGLQVYTANAFRDLAGKAGARYGPGAGVALETQNLPGAPHHGSFPSAVLLPGETYRHTTVFEFSTS